MAENKKRKWLVITAISMTGFILTLCALLFYLYLLYTAGKENNDLLESQEIGSDVVKPESRVSSESEIITDDENYIPKELIKSESSGIDFTQLYEINSEIYAWLKVPNTLVDYPILQSDTDDMFYLKHNVYGQYSFAGAIYTERINKKDFTDPNTVIYGHNMMNNTMFTTLHRFRDPKFFEENEYIYVYLPGRKLTYHIFSAYEYDNRHILHSFDFNDKDEYKKYLEYAQNPTNTITRNTRKIKITADDKIITLSTCMDANDFSRYIVQGVLVEDEPTN